MLLEVGWQYGCCVDLMGYCWGRGYGSAGVVTSPSGRGTLGITVGSTSPLILMVMMMDGYYRQATSDS